MFHKLIASILVVAIAVSRGEAASVGCGLSTYSKFELYSASDSTDGTSLLNVVKIGTDSKNHTISALTTCLGCGRAVTPLYWNLKDSVLSPVIFSADPKTVTINAPVSSGEVTLLTGPKKELTPSPDYCVSRSVNAGAGFSGVLSANGRSDAFFICTRVSPAGSAIQRDIYFKKPSASLATDCHKTTLAVKPAEE